MFIVKRITTIWGGEGDKEREHALGSPSFGFINSPPHSEECNSIGEGDDIQDHIPIKLLDDNTA